MAVKQALERSDPSALIIGFFPSPNEDQSDHRMRPPVVIITGDIQQGKTSFVKVIVQHLQQRKYRISGFLALTVLEGEHRSGFDLFDIQTSETMVLCSLKPVQGWMKQGSFYFNPLGLQKGNEILSGIRSENVQLIDRC